MITKAQKQDYRKFFVEKGEAGFSPKRNKKVIDEVIKDTEFVAKMKHKDYVDKLRERTDAVAHYLKAVEKGKEANVDRYFGKKYLAHLQGQKIVEIIKGKVKELHEVTS